MTLSERNKEIFFSNYIPALYYAGVYEGIIPQRTTLAAFEDAPLQIKVYCRNALFENRDILKYFLSDNKHLLDINGVNFIQHVSKGLLADFIVLKQTKEFAVLAEPGTNTFYEVINITDPFDKMLSGLPVQIKTAIFNFDGKIICDGLLVGGNMHIGPGMTEGILEDYTKAKKNMAVISLIK